MYYCRENKYFILICIAVCLLSLFNIFTIRPILTTLDHTVNRIWKDRIDLIKTNIRDSFIVKGNMTIDKPAIYILHPHGICSLTHVFHVGTNLTNWPYKKIRGVIHKIITTCPLLKDFIDTQRVVESDYKTMLKHLKSGESMSICLGNFTEGKYTDDRSITAIVSKRKGIFKLAIETGIPIVPVISYGEQCAFKQQYTFGILEAVSKHIGIQLNLPSFASIMEWFTIYSQPLKNKIYTHIGDPITPDKTISANDLKEKYIDSLKALYKQTRPKGYQEDIIIV